MERFLSSQDFVPPIVCRSHGDVLDQKTDNTLNGDPSSWHMAVDAPGHMHMRVPESDGVGSRQ